MKITNTKEWGRNKIIFPCILGTIHNLENFCIDSFYIWHTQCFGKNNFLLYTVKMQCKNILKAFQACVKMTFWYANGQKIGVKNADYKAHNFLRTLNFFRFVFAL